MGVLCKNGVLLKILENLQENLSVEMSFSIKLQAEDLHFY